MTGANATNRTEIAEALRQAVLEYYAEREETLEGQAGELTLATNSTLIERRGRPLLEMLRIHAGVQSVDGLKVLDLGCGFGALSALFAAEGSRVTGVDVNGSRFEVGNRVGDKYALDLEFVKARMQDLPLQSRRFDLVVMNNSLCYLTRLDDRRAALREALRTLRPGGWLATRNPNRWAPVDPFTSLPLLALLGPQTAERVTAVLGRRRSRVRLVSPRGAKAELIDAGFTDVVHAPVPGRHRPRSLDLVATYLHVLGRRPNG